MFFYSEIPTSIRRDADFRDVSIVCSGSVEGDEDSVALPPSTSIRDCFRASLLSNGGFTLIEMLVVIAIISIIGTMVISNVFRVIEKQKIAQTKTTITNVAMSMTEYASISPNGRYPEATASEDGFGTADLVKKLHETVGTSFISDELTDDTPPKLCDGWGQPMRYRPWKGAADKTGARNPKSYDLFSLGPDGILGGDDIDNFGTGQ